MSVVQGENEFDYSYVHATARIALYDDLKSAPRITEIPPAPTNEFIEKLTTTIYEQSKLAGGKVPYTLIREVSENLIHAQFREIVVSILDEGNTIRFADQGPGIREKENAQKPGFSSAIEPMKKYIRGVGSGFPIVKDYLDDRDGSILIEDNLSSGAVITISLEHPKLEPDATVSQDVHHSSAYGAPAAGVSAQGMRPSPLDGYGQDVVPVLIDTKKTPRFSLPLSDRERLFLQVLAHEGELGVTELKDLTGTAGSTTYNTLKKLEEMALVEWGTGKKRTLTPLGYQIASNL